MSNQPANEQSEKGRLARFFEGEEVPYGLAIVRILLPLVLLIPMVPRWFHARELYSTDGAPAPLADGYGYHGLLPEFPGIVVVALFTALLFFLVTSAIGWRTRLSLICATVLYTYFCMTDSISTMTKYSVIASHVLLLLSCSRCGAIWSVDAWLAGPVPTDPNPVNPRYRLPRVPVWPRRLIQCLMGFVYFGAAITKMHTPAYFSGDQLLFWMRTHVNYGHPIGEILTLFPPLLVVFAYIAIVWEVLFLFLVWRGWGRVAMLGIGVLFHLMTTLTLGLYVFPAVCISAYWAFLEERDVRRLARWWRRWKRAGGWLPAFVERMRTAIPNPTGRPRLAAVLRTAFVPGVLAVAGLGVAAEYAVDPYGMRRPEGPLPLQEVSAEKVRTMLAGRRPLREKDKFYSFEVGTRLISGILVNRRQRFRHGETLVAQCMLNPPHEDMWIECRLVDAQNRTIDRVAHPLPREIVRSHFTYRLDESLEPGEYSLMLKSGGEEVARRRITLVPNVRMSAN